MSIADVTFLSGEYRKKVEQIYNENKKLMFYIAMKIVRNPDHAEDIVHSSFIRIIRHIEKINTLTHEETKGYIIFIVKNLSLDFISQHENKMTVSLQGFEEFLGSQHETEKNAIINIELTKLIECMDNLDPKYSFAVFHKYVLGYSMAEIAELLSISIENAKTRCHRGRLKLINMLLEGEANE